MIPWPAEVRMKFLNFSYFSFWPVVIMCFFYKDAFAMLKALDTSAAGMAAQEINVNTISNNLANLNTTGFKRERAEFEDLLYETVQEAGSMSGGSARYNVGTQVGSGAKVSATRKDFLQGSPQITNNPFDLMISGSGFFGIILPNNELRFTRDGTFNVDSQGQLVTRAGYRVFPGITLPIGVSSVAISENGTVEVYFKNQPEANNVGQIAVFTFVNPVGLKNAGGNLYQVTISSGQPQQGIGGENSAGMVVQGSLEVANVNVMTEMTDLIKAQRAYEMNSKVMGVVDQMLKTVTTLR